jgi:hypothetical protein
MIGLVLRAQRIWNGIPIAANVIAMLAIALVFAVGVTPVFAGGTVDINPFRWPY